jgi:deoxyribodipyrimidine photo-lyase
VKERIRELNGSPLRSPAKYVLYWSQMNRRVDSNHALEHAASVANELDLPLLVYESLTFSYPYASDRFHTFILEGSAETTRRLKSRGAGYVFYLRRAPGDPNDVLYRLAGDAALVVTDDYPTFVTPRHNAAVAPKIGVAFHAVDSSCVVPMSCFTKREYAAYTIRPKIHRLLPQFLRPVEPVGLRRRYRGPQSPFHTRVTAKSIPELVASCQIDHSIPPSTVFRGGRIEAEKRLRFFLDEKLPRYETGHNDPTAHATSDLSPYLHFGCISSLEVALAAPKSAQAFLEELIVRRELAFNFARFTEDPESLANVPEWAQKTMREHARDKRPAIYTRDQFAQAVTHDALWNATQREMLKTGKIHGYYRMYWGKKVIEWSHSYQEALETMLYIHDRWALDGRDPNTYANILWLFGLFDRPWPERPIFGKMRYMSLEGMRRKTDVAGYIAGTGGLDNTSKSAVISV